MSKFLNLAVRTALKSQNPRAHVGAVVVRGGAVLAVAFNPCVRKTHRRYPWWIWPHAEIIALARAGWPRGVKLFVARVGKNGDVKPGAPCELICKPVLDKYGISVQHT